MNKTKTFHAAVKNPCPRSLRGATKGVLYEYLKGPEACFLKNVVIKKCGMMPNGGSTEYSKRARTGRDAGSGAGMGREFGSGMGTGRDFGRGAGGFLF